MFDARLLTNKAFMAQPLVYDELLPERSLPEGERTGVFYNDNGDITIKLYAPGIDEVQWQISTAAYRKIGDKIPMTKTATGMFEGVIKHGTNRNGPMTVDLYFDGVRLLYPLLPIYWSANTVCNYVEFPDTELEFSYIHDVPHGAVTHQIYWSSLRNNYERCLVYTPPGYMNGSEHYPVLYLQHGGGENETVWESTGRISNIMDNLIAAGECVPFIVVMNNNMLREPGHEGMVADRGFEHMLIDECIPFIENNYRTLRGKWNRAICGLSMGSYLSNDIALFNPDVFGYVGALTGCMYKDTPGAFYTRPWKDFVHDGRVVLDNYRVFFQSATPQEDHLDFCLIDNEICRDNGVAAMPGYRFIVHPERTTKWSSWRLGIRDFAKLLFRPAELYENAEKLKEVCGV